MNKSSDKWLLIDNSNTRTKLVFADSSGLCSEVYYLPTANLSEELLHETIEYRSFSRVVVCSVVPCCHKIFSAAFQERVHFLTAESPMDMDFDYDGTSTLGADRIANSLAVADLCRGPVIAIDAGTATTFDVVLHRDERSVYRGGVIAPGVDAFSSYLHHNTAQLPLVSVPSSCEPIGRNTIQAIQAGSLYGFCGMVQGILSAIESGLTLRPELVFTGGDAPLLLRHGNFNAGYEKYLTLYGLLHVARRL